MRLSRRTLFQAALGASQLALLERFGLTEARAATASGGPTKLLSIHLNGGVHWETFFSPLTTAGIRKYIPEPTGMLQPWGYSPGQVLNLDGSVPDLNAPGPISKLRGPVYYNAANPTDATGLNPLSGGMQNFRPYGYVWSDPDCRLFERTVLLVGADQNTAAHVSGIVASMCGVAGANFRAPSVQAVTALAMSKRFPDRPIPNVSLGGLLPSALGLPALAGPTILSSPASVEPTLSDRRESAWKGLRARTPIANLGFDGSAMAGTVPATTTDAAVLAVLRATRGQNAPGTEKLLEQLYDTYKGASSTLARDVLSVLERTTGFEKLQANPRYPTNWSACIGLADACGSAASMGPYDFALRLLKSDLVTSVSLQGSSLNNNTFDTHTANGPQLGTNHLRIALEAVGRMIAEMRLTPSPSNPQRSLLDETVVYVYSDFGRTFPKRGSDHHPATCALIAGGGVIGNRMIGRYDESINGSPMGTPVALIEESGERTTRTPRSQDIAATVLHAMGLKGGTDFFIPGGYGVFDGAVG